MVETTARVPLHALGRNWRVSTQTRITNAAPIGCPAFPAGLRAGLRGEKVGAVHLELARSPGVPIACTCSCGKRLRACHHPFACQSVTLAAAKSYIERTSGTWLHAWPAGLA